MVKFFYPLVENPYRPKDIKEGIKVLKSNRLTIGSKTLSFEQAFTKKLKVKNSLMVNSGSSANLLALQCLINPYRKKRLKRGDEVIVPSLCWSTSLWPIIQSGLKPVFVDVDIFTLNIDLNDLKKKINKKTKAILLVHVLGNCTDMDELMKIKKKNNLFLIEDTCESLGSKYRNKYLGTFGDFSSFSFYSSHQISSGEGGMICCKNNEDLEILKSLRSHGWSRGLKKEKNIASNNKNLDKRFIFYNSGFNLRPTDIAASIGHSQFKDLDKFIIARALNRKNIKNEFYKNKKISKHIHIIEQTNNVNPSWFGIPMFVSKKIKKNEFIKKIERLGIETRPIISGNFLKQPSIKKYQINPGKKLKNADFINDYGFFIGLPITRLTQSKIKKMVNSFEKSL